MPSILKGTVRCLRGHTSEPTRGVGQTVNFADGPARHPVVRVDVPPSKRQGYIYVTAILHQDAFGVGADVPGLKDKRRYVRIEMTQEDYEKLPLATYHLRDGRIWFTGGDTYPLHEDNEAAMEAAWGEWEVDRPPITRSAPKHWALPGYEGTEYGTSEAQENPDDYRRPWWQ